MRWTVPDTLLTARSDARNTSETQKSRCGGLSAVVSRGKWIKKPTIEKKSFNIWSSMWCENPKTQNASKTLGKVFGLVICVRFMSPTQEADNCFVRSSNSLLISLPISQHVFAPSIKNMSNNYSVLNNNGCNTDSKTSCWVLAPLKMRRKVNREFE